MKSSSATEAVAKITKLSKLVLGANVTIRDIFIAQAIKDNIPDGGKIALINTLASLDRQLEQTRFTEFKSAFRQTFSVPPSETFVNFDNKKNYSKDYSNGQRETEGSGTAGQETGGPSLPQLPQEQACWIRFQIHIMSDNDN